MARMLSLDSESIKKGERTKSRPSDTTKAPQRPVASSNWETQDSKSDTLTSDRCSSSGTLRGKEARIESAAEVSHQSSGAMASVASPNSSGGTLHRSGATAGAGNQLKRSNWHLLGLALFFLFYLALGASVFSAIESPIEKDAMQILLDRRNKFLLEHPCVTDSALDELMDAIVEANNRGVSLGPRRENGSIATNVPSWSFGQSFFFASTVVTTIGYGHQSPLSTPGKVFCIVYALIGIPLTMLLLAAFVERLQVPTTSCLKLMNIKLGHLYSPFCIRILHFIMVVLLVICLMFLIPASIFTALEPKWDFSDSLYYCFISLTTIGLGDFIPGDNPGQQLRPLYKACTTIYLLMGVTAMMLTLSVFYSIPEFDLSTMFMLSCSSNNRFEYEAAPDEAAGTAPRGRFAADPERIRLHSTSTAPGPRYTQHVDEPEDGAGNALNTRRIIRARSRPDDDSPSPADEGPTPGPSGRVRLP